MKILVVGCGSIGQRHLRNLAQIGAGALSAFDIDQARLREVGSAFPKIETHERLESAFRTKPDVVFVTVPTALHVRYALAAAERGCHLFIEKPLSNNTDGVRALIRTAARKRLTTMVGCNMRFYWAIQTIQRLLAQSRIGKIYSARVEAGQYLPDWHPKEDYRKLYSANQRLGGGVILDAIHEIDYCRWFFGKVSKIEGMYGRLGGLDIDTEDVAEMLLKFDRGPLVSIHLDYLYRDYLRRCLIMGENGTISWDLQEHVVKLSKAHQKKPTLFREPPRYSMNQMYVDEVRYFLGCVKNRTQTFNGVAEAFQTLDVALSLKRDGVRCHG